jgi:putative membrane protein
MREGFRYALLSAAVAGLVVTGAAAQSSGSSSAPQSSSTTAQNSAAHHAKGTMDKGSSSPNAFDRHFVKKAVQGGMAEVELGKLATEKGQSDQVKKFAQRMVDDHSKANEQLKQLAGSKGIPLPKDLDAKDKAAKKRLSKLGGEQFDRAYMSDMVADHTQDVSEFQQESTTAKDTDIKNFAAQTLPTLEDHLKEARSIAPKEQKIAAMQK